MTVDDLFMCNGVSPTVLKAPKKNSDKNFYDMVVIIFFLVISQLFDINYVKIEGWQRFYAD